MSKRARALLTQQEGRRNFPYEDTVGKVTIGIGYNLTDLGLPDHIIDELFDKTYTNAYKEARKYDWFKDLTEVRQAVVVNMMFNLGAYRFSGFKRMLQAMEVGNWSLASTEMLDSKWSQQVGKRALTLSAMMRYGNWPHGI